MQIVDARPERPGYRLYRLEVFNWGTFDSTAGQVFRFEPQGRTSLLVGHNGSGKSTLVDAITTLLVDNRSRNYNVAAGAKRSERTPKSYIKGAFDRTADGSQSSVVRFLRPNGRHLTAISAVFRDEQLDQTFTLVQVLFLKADGSDDKIYALADAEHELKDDLQGILNSDGVRDRLKKSGFQTTKAYVEYLSWITARTGMRAKAVDMFNQTVAVKDIQSLNSFIRKHMLESHNWREKIRRLLTHFNDLSTAHQELVRARRQVELLTPVEQLGQRYLQQADELQLTEQQLEASAFFFPVQFVQLFEPEVSKQRENVVAMDANIKHLDDELRSTREAIRQLQNELDQAGGQRWRQLPGLIDVERTRLVHKQAASDRLHQQLKKCRIRGVISSPDRLETVREHLCRVSAKTQVELAKRKTEHEAMIGKRAGVEIQLREERSELESLRRRRSNLPSKLAALRGQICSELKIDESALPFAGELISVSSDQGRWEASVEMVLHAFARSLLVPERFYKRVRAYVASHRLQDDQGRGGRLDYIRIGAPKKNGGDRIHANSLVNKLHFKRRHELSAWVKSEIVRSFDFRCCETIEEFDEIPRLALTENRHVKYSTELHKKDDRQRSVDPRHFVLGWDNTEKQSRIIARIDELMAKRSRENDAVASCEEKIAHMEEVLRAAEESLTVTHFDSIDVKRHDAELAALEKEQLELEGSGGAVKILRKRLQDALKAESRLAENRDHLVGKKATLEKEIKQLTARIEKANTLLQDVTDRGLFDAVAAHFESIAASIGPTPLTVQDFDQRQQQWKSRTRHKVAELRGPLQQQSEKLLGVMTQFLREFKEEQSDLDASVDALSSFVGLLVQLKQEDLPRHERQFKERLNDQVTQEIALFHTELRQECKSIEGKIQQLNEALASVEYDRVRGTFMQLEPRPVQDREVDDFRRSLRDCLDESLEHSGEANEARFQRIKTLVDRLGDQEKATWRNKVIDVRNWYDFAALELSRDTEETRSCYDGSSGQSGGEKAKLAFTILVAALAYQFDIDPTGSTPGRFQFVVIDEMFSKVDDQNAQYALQLFKQFGLQLLIVAPLDAKARVTEPFVDRYLHVVKDADSNQSQLYSMTAREYDEVVQQFSTNGNSVGKGRMTAK